jgi:hypothetical protein
MRAICAHKHRFLRRYDPDQVRWVGLRLSAPRGHPNGCPVRGMIDSLIKVIEALDSAGVELIAEGAPSPDGGRGLRLKDKADRPR